MTLLLKDLANDKGIQHLIETTGGPRSFYNNEQRINEIQQIVTDALLRYPRLANTKIVINPKINNAFFDYDHGVIILGRAAPIGLAHEIEHAVSIQQHGLYRKVLKAAQGVSQVNNIIALPTVLALRTFIDDKDKQNDILKVLSAVSAAVAAPELLEEAQASIRTIANSPDKLQAIKTLGPALLAHTKSKFLPPTIYQIGRSE